MAVDDLSRRVLYVGDGSSTEFAFNFVVFVTTDVAVYTQDEEGEDKLISSANYTVTLNENQDNNPGGVVRFNSAPADEAVIAVVSAVPETQPMVLTTYDGFDPEVLNKSADRAVSLIQQLSDDVSRAIRLPRTSQKTTAAAYEELASAAETANKALALMDETLDAAAEVRTAIQEAGDVTGATQVVASGATAPRSVSSKLADTMTIADFGATADGVTDDTSAMVHADASGCTTLDLRGKTVATTYYPTNIELTNGYLNYRGQFFNVDGAKTARGALAAHKHLADLAVYNADGTAATTYPTRIAQGITYLNDSGTERVFMSYRSYGVSNGHDHQMCSLVEYHLGADGETLDHAGETVALPIGHGQGLGIRKTGGGTIYIYAMESSIPTRYLAQSANYGKGFSRIEYNGTNTAVTDVVNYRLLPYHKPNRAAALDPYSTVYNLTPTVTPDGKRIILIGSSLCFIYDLEEVEACTTADTVYSWSDAGTTDPNTDSESDQSRWALPASQIDASSVAPLAVFPIDTSTVGTLQAVATDGTFIYIAAGADNPNKDKAIEVYDFEGNLIRIIKHQGGRALYTQTQLEGGDSDLGVMKKDENEGIFVRGDQLVCLQCTRWYPVADIVTFGSLNYICTTSCTGQQPNEYATGYWLPTRLAATAGTWNASTTYAPGAFIGNRNTEGRRLVAVEPFDPGDAGQIPIAKNAHKHSFLHSQVSTHHTTLLGNDWVWKYEDPYTRTTSYAVRFGANGVWAYAGNDPIGTDFGKSYSEFAIVEQDGSYAVPYYRGYPSTDPNLPNIGRIITPTNYLLAQIGGAYDSWWQRIGTSMGSRSWGLFAPNASYSENVDLCAKVYASSTGTYFMGVNRNFIIGRMAYDYDTQTFTYHMGVGLYRSSFTPVFGSSSPYQSISLGSASYHWSEIYADTGSINTSDERKKANIRDPEEALMRAWGRVNFKVFQFKDALEKKGDAARLHVGLVAQQVREAFAAEGLDADRYGLFCYDKWEAKAAEIDPETGEVVEPAVEAGDAYGIRYDEALALECAYQRWRLAKIEERLG